MVSEPDRLAVGIDVGGTKILAAVVDVATGSVVGERRTATGAVHGGEHVLRQCVALADDLCAAHRVDLPLIGIALCEVVTPRGIPSSAATVDWIGLDVPGAFAGASSVVIESDVRAAAIAEARFGAGRDAEHFVYLTVGTGIAHSLVVRGEPYRGHRGAAILVGAPPVERLASGAAIAARTGVATAEEAFADPGAGAVIADAATRLGQAMAWLSVALDPELIVVGGGLGLRTEYREAAVAAMRDAARDAGAEPVRVVAAGLGPASASIGAALAVARGQCGSVQSVWQGP